MKIKIFTVDKTMPGAIATNELEKEANMYLKALSKEKVYQVIPIADKNGHAQQIMIITDND